MLVGHRGKQNDFVLCLSSPFGSLGPAVGSRLPPSSDAPFWLRAVEHLFVATSAAADASRKALFVEVPGAHPRPGEASATEGEATVECEVRKDAEKGPQ